jgi:hypothetical protein
MSVPRDANQPVRLWVALLNSFVVTVLAFLLGAMLAPCVDYIGF